MNDDQQNTMPEQPVQTQTQPEQKVSPFHEQSLPATPVSSVAPSDSRVETHDRAVTTAGDDPQKDESPADPADVVNPNHLEDDDPESHVGEPAEQDG